LPPTDELVSSLFWTVGGVVLLQLPKSLATASGDVLGFWHHSSRIWISYLLFLQFEIAILKGEQTFHQFVETSLSPIFSSDLLGSLPPEFQRTLSSSTIHEAFREV
jgi:hypothetical protein